MVRTRIAAAMQRYIQGKDSSIGAFADITGISRSAAFKFSKFRPADDLSEPQVPEIEVLKKICVTTGVSADWLLGFDDTKYLRVDNSTVGELGDQLRKAIEATSPGERWETPLPESSTELAKLVIETWWGQQFMKTAKEWARRLDALSVRMYRDSSNAQDGIEQNELQRIAGALRREASEMLDPFTAPWDRLEMLEQVGPLAALSNFHLRKQGEPVYRTAFPVVGPHFPCGLAWRGEHHDNAWYIDPKTFKIKVKQSGRFLVPIE